MYEYAKQQQREEVEAIVKLLESNSLKIEGLQVYTIINATNKVAAESAGREIAALKKQNKDLEKSFEHINDEQYLVQLTNKILEKKIPKDHYKGSLLNFVNTVTFTTVGSIAGGAIGMLGGARTAVVGAGLGAGIGGAAAKKVRETNCNQQ